MTIVHKALSLLYGSLPKKLLYSIAFFVLLVVLVFCIFYRINDYAHLQHWFLSLNGCFYKKESWSHDFFTPAVKATGNQLAVAGAGVAVILAALVTLSWQKFVKNKANLAPPVISSGLFSWYIAVALLALSLGMYSGALMFPAYDEIFSAVNCAELHPFQTIAYYMLPNNHLYYNFINNILFSWWVDPVRSGRLLSLIAYAGVLLLAFHWLRKLMANSMFAFIALLPVALQFMTWGMAGQARGYELQLLCSWASLITMFRYAREQDGRILAINTFFNILGFALVATYLLYYVAQTILLFCVMLYKRRLQWSYLRHVCYVAGFVFLLYLPALCFSGIPAFTSNIYVVAYYNNWMEFLPSFSINTNSFINSFSSMAFGGDTVVNYALFFLPLFLFLSRRKERRLMAFFYLLLWLAYVINTVHMRHNPFNRNMIMHYSITIGFMVFTFYLLVKKAVGFLPSANLSRSLSVILFCLPILALAGFQARYAKRSIATDLYEYDVNKAHISNLSETQLIDNAATIGCSNESFHFYYYLRKKHPNTYRCATYREDYIIKHIEEAFPAGVEKQYTRFYQEDGKYTFFRRNTIVKP